MSDFTPRTAADEEWDSLLRQWRNQPQAQPRPFFYSRVRIRLVAEVTAERQLLPSWLRWPSYAAMLIIVLLLSGDGAAPRSAKSTNQSQLFSPAD